ncbi:MAG: hypothetical protein CSA50_08035 [Gammaproteobacteria bacterium]|nr:MAG: hypothetical protein CSA50_08035 [Gammaproteobacteria bacterium]
MKGAKVYCRLQGYLSSTCRKNNVGAVEALGCLFTGKWPDCIQQELNQMHFAAEWLPIIK